MAVAALAPVVHPKATPEESAPARASCSVRLALPGICELTLHALTWCFAYRPLMCVTFVFAAFRLK